MILQTSFRSWLAVASTIFAAVAAIAKIIAVIYARETVNESQAATWAIAEQHREQIAALKPRPQLSHASSHKKLSERRIAFDHDLAVQRLTQLRRVSGALNELIHATCEERTKPSERIVDTQPGRGLSSTRIPALQRQLRIEVRILNNWPDPT